MSTHIAGALIVIVTTFGLVNDQTTWRYSVNAMAFMFAWPVGTVYQQSTIAAIGPGLAGCFLSDNFSPIVILVSITTLLSLVLFLRLTSPRA